MCIYIYTYIYTHIHQVLTTGLAGNSPDLFDLDGKEFVSNIGDLGSIPGLGRSLEKEIAVHSNIFAWRIPWTEEPVWTEEPGGVSLPS